MDRKSSGPLRPCRRLRASRTASLRDSGCSDLRRATSSSRVACMTSMSSGSGLRSDLARASLPRSATSRRRISFSISCRSWSIRAWNSSRSSRSSSGGEGDRRRAVRSGAVVVERRRGRPGPRPSAAPAPRRGRGSAGSGRGSRSRPPAGPASMPAYRLTAWRATAGHHGVVGPEQGLVEQVGQLLGGHPLARRRSPGPGPGPAARPGRRSGRRRRSSSSPGSSSSSSIRYSGPRSEK